MTYLNHEHTLASWLLTKDHKRIGILYLLVVTVAFFVGGLFATLLRLELATPAGDYVAADTYNKLFTMHGVTMVFFVLIPAVPAFSATSFFRSCSARRTWRSRRSTS